MSVIRWDPFGNVSALQDRINRLFEDAFPPGKEMDGDIHRDAWKPDVDIFESDDGLILMAELPGVRKEDLSVEVKDNLLTFRGVRVLDEAMKAYHCLRRERQFGPFLRAFTLESPVQPDRVRAQFKTGVLRIEIPKPETDALKKVHIQVE